MTRAEQQQAKCSSNPIFVIHCTVFVNLVDFKYHVILLELSCPPFWTQRMPIVIALRDALPMMRKDSIFADEGEEIHSQQPLHFRLYMSRYLSKKDVLLEGPRTLTISQDPKAGFSPAIQRFRRLFSRWRNHFHPNWILASQGRLFLIMKGHIGGPTFTQTLWTHCPVSAMEDF